MKPSPSSCALVLLAVLLSSCATPKICPRPLTRSEPAALALLKASQKAHGAAAFAKVRAVEISYEGKWGAIGPKFQPVLVDGKFRGGSVEQWTVASRSMQQSHHGQAGSKAVLRSPGKVTVAYNGIASQDPEIKDAAALVADAYSMFLLGPLYFDRPGVTVAGNGTSLVDQQLCDDVLAVLRPGFGRADEDRVVLSMDRTTRQLRRVRMTLNGLESTRGAEVDVTFRKHRTIGGVLWATDFDERIRVPFDLHAHHWTLEAIKLQR